MARGARFPLRGVLRGVERDGVMVHMVVTGHRLGELTLVPKFGHEYLNGDIPGHS